MPQISSGSEHRYYKITFANDGEESTLRLNKETIGRASERNVGFEGVPEKVVLESYEHKGRSRYTVKIAYKGNESLEMSASYGSMGLLNSLLSDDYKGGEFSLVVVDKEGKSSIYVKSNGIKISWAVEFSAMRDSLLPNGVVNPERWEDAIKSINDKIWKSQSQ
jgi:hypothetical protein